MTDKATTPPLGTAATGSSPLTSAAKRVRTTSSSAKEPFAEDGQVERDNDSDGDSGLGTDSSDTTSIASSIYAGYVENGRRYQTMREGEYWGPSDEKQWESQQAAHVMMQILDSAAPNPLFRAPVPDTVQNILDIGTGTGNWAQDVADRCPQAVVQGVDLYPPPETWVPPNCRFTVEDVLKPWVFPHKFDMVHLRWMYGSFTDEQWRLVYKQAYNNLAPGGWIEQVEPSIPFFSDDGSLPADSLLAGWGPNAIACCERAGKPIDTADTFKSRIEAHGGFTNIQEKVYKVPFGGWAKNRVLKEAGMVNKKQFMQGMEGYAMLLLTHFGAPTPWTPEEVQVYLAKVRQEMNKGWHLYLIVRRVWAQKAEKKIEVESVAA